MNLVNVKTLSRGLPSRFQPEVAYTSLVMKKDKEIERQVLARYIELAGLVKDGQMINRDKESRAREYVKSRTKVQARVVDQISEGSKIKKNSKYGELIVQANRVQYYLTKLVLLRSLDPSGAFEK